MNQFLRSFIKVILTILLVLSLVSFILSLSFFQFTSHNNLEPRVTAFVEQEYSKQIQNNPEDFEKTRSDIIEDCSNNSEIDYFLENQDIIEKIHINCSGINNEMGDERLIEIISNNLFNSVYYKEYDCSIINCFTNAETNPENVTVIFSKKANDFFFKFTILFLIVSLVLIALLILLNKPKFTVFYNLAPAFLISGLLFLVGNPLSNLTKEEPFSSLITSLSKNLSFNFLMLLILGAIFLALAILFNLLKKKSK